VQPTAATMPYDSEAHRALRRGLWSLICSRGGVQGDGDAASVQVDARYGREVPTSRAEALDLAVRHRARQLIWRGEQTTIPGDVARDRELRSRLVVGPGVASIRARDGSLVAEFRRCLPSVPLDPDLAPLVRDARAARTLGEILRQRGGAALTRIDELESLHVASVLGPGQLERPARSSRPRRGR
jgi:hypothetical protein